MLIHSPLLEEMRTAFVFSIEKKNRTRKMENQAVGAGCGKRGESWGQGQTSHEAAAGGLLLPGQRKHRRLLLGHPSTAPSLHGHRLPRHVFVVHPSKAPSTHHQTHQAQAPSFELVPGLTLPIPTRPSGTGSSLRPLQSARRHGVPPHLLKQHPASPQG